MKKAILTIMFGLGLLLGLQGCNDKQTEYEPAEEGTPSDTIPKEGPVEEPLPSEEEGWSEEPVEPEETPEPEPEPDSEDIPETEPSESDVEG